jgi:hypothetical protein
MTFLKRNRAATRRIRFLHCLRIFAVFCGFVLCGEFSIYAQVAEIKHRGFKADYSQIKDSPQKDTIIKAVKRQIEIVERVKNRKLSC